MIVMGAAHSPNQADPNVHHICTNCPYYQRISGRDIRPELAGMQFVATATILMSNGGC